jgi:hypothetical protein
MTELYNTERGRDASARNPFDECVLITDALCGAEELKWRNSVDIERQ